MNEFEIVNKLKKLRLGLESQSGEAVADIPTNVGFILLDVCEALELNEVNIIEVLGDSMNQEAQDHFFAGESTLDVQPISTVQQARPRRVIPAALYTKPVSVGFPAPVAFQSNPTSD